MPELQRLHAGHAPAVLALELANRAYFAAFVFDRGDEFFGQFTGRHSALPAGQEAGIGAFVDWHRIQSRDDLQRYAVGVLGTASLLLTQMRYQHAGSFRNP